MTPRPSAPHLDLQRVTTAQGRFSAAIGDFRDEQVGLASTLPGWTVGHLLTHVARNADSHVRRAQAAQRGEVVEQYPGGFEARAAEIERGARRPAGELIEDVRRSAERLQMTWTGLPDTAWSGITLDVSGRERPLDALPGRRWHELEIHLVDLDLGFSHRDWSDDFVDTWLPRIRPSAGDRLPPGARLPEPGTLDSRDELAWLYGRLRRTGLPELAPWS